MQQNALLPLKFPDVVLIPSTAANRFRRPQAPSGARKVVSPRHDNRLGTRSHPVFRDESVLDPVATGRLRGARAALAAICKTLEGELHRIRLGREARRTGEGRISVR